jgi:CHASE3 domain sensor protein
MEELKVLLRDDAATLRSVTELEPLVSKHLKVVKDLVEVGNKNLFRGFSQRGLTDEGNTLMEQIRTAVSTVDKEQRTRLDEEQRTVAMKAGRLTTGVVMFPSLFLAILLPSSFEVVIMSSVRAAVIWAATDQVP